ncbi:ABC transporter substrate-binding protein [Hoeflea prorocentri]|uniref:ABC transporter substrate-binding protein n=1 Tax=Hoeflea prorocentri TaxID=1922333 RepID=A0A9X3UFL4_9HYPH|nr:ABC transporter substrate-binding protein [Hoeflea prorocentri]MCY6379811.1 ABC transporter substrate-binding protein [Hoeflea prorocentri]MDA5397611.1 ABC transporter substrate-binding protein [Hoeflea prorocentri]
MRHLAKCALFASAVAFAPLAHADTADGESLIGKPWEEVVEMARGGTVNWFLWGGSDNINRYVSEYIGGILKDEYDITLNRVGLSDTVEAVNIVLGEVESGVTDKGSVDMIWINGENFRTMKQGDLAYCGYPDTLPNNKLVDWNNPSIANDFGVPVDGCEIPWSKAQFAFAYDTARTENPPRSIPELLEWIKANPGSFTYPAPPDFNGSVFVRHVFYHAAGGVDNLLGAFDQAKYDAAAAETWRILNEIEPYLWREGKTYPTSINALEQLFANSEVDLYFNYEPAGVGINIDNGTFPPTAKGYGLTDGTIGNTNYTIIPINSPNKAAALVLQNVLLSGEAQYEKAKPDVWGTSPAIEVSRTSDEVQKQFASLKKHPAVVPASELSKAALPELQADWITAIEKGWIENVGQ